MVAWWHGDSPHHYDPASSCVPLPAQRVRLPACSLYCRNAKKMHHIYSIIAFNVNSPAWVPCRPQKVNGNSACTLGQTSCQQDDYLASNSKRLTHPPSPLSLQYVPYFLLLT